MEAHLGLPMAGRRVPWAKEVHRVLLPARPVRVHQVPLLVLLVTAIRRVLVDQILANLPGNRVRGPAHPAPRECLPLPVCPARRRATADAASSAA